MESESLSIGELALRAGQSVSALRYYDEVGLLKPSHRVGGQRRYLPQSVRRLDIIAACQDAGFTLAEIRGLLSGGVTKRSQFTEIARRKVAELEGRMERAWAAKQLLEEAIRCRCTTLEECEVITARGEHRQGHQRRAARTQRSPAPSKWAEPA